MRMVVTQQNVIYRNSQQDRDAKASLVSPYSWQGRDNEGKQKTTEKEADVLHSSHTASVQSHNSRMLKTQVQNTQPSGGYGGAQLKPPRLEG